LKQWKVSPIDEEAVSRWKDYSRARNVMLSRTHHAAAPWTVVRADRKRLARINLIRDVLARLHYGKKDETLLVADPAIVFRYDHAALENGSIAP
jgi:polyphosphate kinase 2 (PPK2 family)